MDATQSGAADMSGQPSSDGIHEEESLKQGSAGLPSPHPKKRRVLIWILLLLIAGAVFYSALEYHGNAQTAARPLRKRMSSVPVTAATVKKGNIGVYLEAIGTVTPVYTASVTAQINGIVTAVNYREGEMVQKGD